MTIKTHLQKMLLWLASFLTASRGQVLACALRLQSAESSVRIVTSNTQSPSMATTPTMPSKPASVPLQVATNSIYKDPQGRLHVRYTDPFAMMHDLVTGKLPCSKIPMDKWIEGTVMAMVEKKQPELELEVPYGGGLYLFSHYIKTIRPPVGDVATVTEDIH